jgi:hypothetical protein
VTIELQNRPNIHCARARATEAYLIANVMARSVNATLGVRRIRMRERLHENMTLRTLSAPCNVTARLSTKTPSTSIPEPAAK